MTDAPRSSSDADAAGREPAGLPGELRAAFGLRWELARIELLESRAAVRRLAYTAVPCAALAAAVIPLAAVAAAERLAGIARLGKVGWLLVFAAVMGSIGAGVGWLAWRRFRREFSALEQTREELREDLAWLREWFTSRS